MPSSGRVVLFVSYCAAAAAAAAAVAAAVLRGSRVSRSSLLDLFWQCASSYRPCSRFPDPELVTLRLSAVLTARLVRRVSEDAFTLEPELHFRVSLLFTVLGLLTHRLLLLEFLERLAPVPDSSSARPSGPLLVDIRFCFLVT